MRKGKALRFFFFVARPSFVCAEYLLFLINVSYNSCDSMNIQRTSTITTTKKSLQLSRELNMKSKTELPKTTENTQLLNQSCNFLTFRDV